MSLKIGKVINSVGEELDDFKLPKSTFLKHLVCFGGSGSGKTYFLKKIIEVASLSDVPSLIIDTQGDFSSLIYSSDQKFKDVKKAIYTPTRTEGIALSFNPFFDTTKDYDDQELIDLITNTADSFTELVGYDLNSHEGKSVSAIMYMIFKHSYEKSIPLTFNSVVELIDGDFEPKVVELLNKSKKIALVKKIKLMTIGKNKLLFESGMKFDIDSMFSDSTINIINLSGVDNQNTRHYIINMILNSLYTWMIKHPKNSLQGLFVLDEIAEYIPAGQKKPLTKELLQLIFKQARKFGLGCIIATQNPGDIDYKSIAQFSNWVIGRLNTKQDFKKIESAINSLDHDGDFASELPSLKTGQFLVYSPDNFDQTIFARSDVLLSDHKTLTLADIKKDFDKSRFIHETTIDVQDEMTSQEIQVTVNGDDVDLTGMKKSFPINYEGEVLTKIIQKNKKKFLMMFSDLEQVSEVNRKFLPLYLCGIRIKEKYMMGLKSRFVDYNVFFDARTLNPLSFHGFDFQILNGFDKLNSFSDNAISVFKEIYKKPKITNAEISLNLNISTRSAAAAVKKLIDNDLIVKKNDTSHSVMFSMEVPLKLKKFAIQEDYSFFNAKIDSSERTIDISVLKNLLNVWYDECIISKYEVIYFPYYEVKLKQKNKKRTIFINASSGKLFDF